MNIKRALWLSAAAYLTTFVAGIAVSSVAGIPIDSEGVAFPTEFYVIQIVLMIIIGIAFTSLYFRSPSTSPSYAAGLKFASVVVLVGFIIDFAVFAPILLAEESPEAILSLYGEPLFWVALAALFASAAGTGYYLKKQAS